MNENNKPLENYPRPQFVRENYTSLDGEWEYWIGKDIDTLKEYRGRINVPFSPEVNEHIKHILQPDETLVYHTRFRLPESFKNKQVLLRFLAVDQIADVYLNGHFLGHHVGGFLPFDFELREYLLDVNDLKVVVKDYTDKSYHAIGKQHLKSGGIWYTPQSGIWLPVYLEAVDFNYITNIKITPRYDEKKIEIVVSSKNKEKVTINYLDKVIEGNSDEAITIDASALESWSPSRPKLYEFVAILGDNLDRVRSYFGYRKIEIKKDTNGFYRVYLNDEAIFLHGVLDQGYWCDTLLTPPNDEAYIFDIKAMKEMGFNLLRKHAKIESPRFYYHCDTLGMLVMQDIVNACAPYKLTTVSLPLFSHHHIKDNRYGAFNRKDIDGRQEFVKEIKETTKHLYNSPSIIAWTLFNEAWGQFDANENTQILKNCDPTRLIDQASGWHDQGGGDFCSEHVYFQKFKLPKRPRYFSRALFLSEFGGYALASANNQKHKKFGYKFCKDKVSLTSAIYTLFKRDVIANIKHGLAGDVYTQLSDVEGELNGLYTFDRKTLKVDLETMKDIASEINKEFNCCLKNK